MERINNVGQYSLCIRKRCQLVSALGLCLLQIIVESRSKTVSYVFLLVLLPLNQLLAGCLPADCTQKIS